MNTGTMKLVTKRPRLLQKLETLTLLVHGAYPERFSASSRKGAPVIKMKSTTLAGTLSSTAMDYGAKSMHLRNGWH